MICFGLKYSRQPLAKLIHALLRLPMSFPRKRESRLIRLKTWMPACAGMTFSVCRRVVFLMDVLTRPSFLTESIGAVLVFVALGFGAPSVHGAETKPASQAEWEKVLAAAKKEGQVAVYISGYEEILPEFQKDYKKLVGDNPSPLAADAVQQAVQTLPREPAIVELFKQVTGGGPLPPH